MIQGLPVCTIHCMVVDDADGLQIGIDDDRAHELETPFFQVLADLLGQGILRRHIGHGFQVMVFDLAVRKAPDVFVEGPEFLLHP